MTRIKSKAAQPAAPALINLYIASRHVVEWMLAEMLGFKDLSISGFDVVSRDPEDWVAFDVHRRTTDFNQGMPLLLARRVEMIDLSWVEPGRWRAQAAGVDNMNEGQDYLLTAMRFILMMHHCKHVSDKVTPSAELAAALARGDLELEVTAEIF